MGLSPYLMDHGGRPSKITTLKECDLAVVMPERGKAFGFSVNLGKIGGGEDQGKNRKN